MFCQPWLVDKVVYGYYSRFIGEIQVNNVVLKFSIKSICSPEYLYNWPQSIYKYSIIIRQIQIKIPLRYAMHCEYE